MRRTFFGATLLGLAGILLATGPVLRATVIVPAEFREVVAGSDIIAYGRVTEVRPQWSDDRRRIESYVTFAVATYLKGGSDSTIVFKVPGGQIGRYRTFMMGAPVFEPGDEAILFLKAAAGETPIVFGFNQGVFRVRMDSTTGRRVVASPALLASSDTPAVLQRGSAERRSLPIETFAAQVQSVMAERRGDAR
jgi:hypothetical protein